MGHGGKRCRRTRGGGSGGAASPWPGCADADPVHCRDNDRGARSFATRGRPNRRCHSRAAAEPGRGDAEAASVGEARGCGAAFRGGSGAGREAHHPGAGPGSDSNARRCRAAEEADDLGSRLTPAATLRVSA